LRETQTKNFKVVCDCGTVFSPKRIQSLKILYEPKTQNNKQPSHQPIIVEQKPVIEPEVIAESLKEKIEIPVDLLSSCVKLLTGYGFTEEESKCITTKGYEKNPDSNIGSFKKFILQNLGELNEQH